MLYASRSKGNSEYQNSIIDLTGQSACSHESSTSVQFSSVSQSCPILCDPMNCSMSVLPAHHQLLEFTQTHVHPVSDAIQPSHPLPSPSPPASIFPSIRVFSNESALCIWWPKYWSFSFNISTRYINNDCITPLKGNSELLSNLSSIFHTMSVQRLLCKNFSNSRICGSCISEFEFQLPN